MFLNVFVVLECPVKLMTNSRNKFLTAKGLEVIDLKRFQNFIVGISTYCLNIMD